MWVLILALLVLVSACSSPSTTDTADESGSQPDSTTSTTEGSATTSATADVSPITVTVWVNPSGADSIQQRLVDEFNAENTDIQIEFTPTPNIGEAINISRVAGEGPDVWSGFPPVPAKDAGYALILTDLVSDETIEAYGDYIDGNYENVENGEFWTVPRSFVTIRLVYNKDLFRLAGLDPEQPPTTFSELRSASAAITEAAGGEAFGFALSYAWGGVWTLQIEPLVLAGNPDITGEGIYNRRTRQFEPQHYASAIELYRQLIADGSMFPGVSSLDRDQTRAAFAAGDVAMYVGTTLEVGVLNDQLATDVDWAAARIPIPDGQEFLHTIGTAGDYFFVNPASENIEAAVRVWEFFNGLEVISALTEGGQIFPIHSGVAADSGPADSVQYGQFFPTESDVQWPQRPGDRVEIRGENFRQAINRLILSDEDLDSELATLANTYNEALQAAVEAGDVELSLYDLP